VSYANRVGKYAMVRVWVGKLEWGIVVCGDPRGLSAWRHGDGGRVSPDCDLVCK